MGELQGELGASMDDSSSGRISAGVAATDSAVRFECFLSVSLPSSSRVPLAPHPAPSYRILPHPTPT